MERNKDIMFFEICRLCLEECGYCDIFERDGLSENIQTCTGVKVSLRDNLPQRICKTCLDIVNKAAELRTIAKKNDYHLKTIFNEEEMEVSKATSSEPTETVISTHFEKEMNCLDKNSVIKKFLEVRKDLFESAVTEDSLVCSREVESQPDSSQKPETTKKIKRNNDDTEYKCDVCSKKFDKYKKLYLHNRLHNKNYVCPINLCAKKFSTKGDMEKHIRTHTGEKPYQCNICDRSFAQRGTLRVHKENVH